MVTKRTRTAKEPNTAETPATDAPKPGASGRVRPRKRTDAPAKPPRASAASDPAKPEAEEASKAVETSEKPRSARRASRTAKPKSRTRRWPLVAGGVVLLALLLVAGGFSWDRWLRYDDAAEFQGEWQAHGTTTVVVIDGEVIKLSEDVGYAYELDTGAKTIAFAFGNMEGSGRYRFSLDRSQLVVTDGGGYTGISTLFDDVAWQFDQLVRAVRGEPAPEPPSGEGVTVLDRLSHDATAAPQTGEPVEPAAEPEAAAEPKPAAAPDAGAEAPAADQGPEASGDATNPRETFDVSDLPA